MVTSKLQTLFLKLTGGLLQEAAFYSLSLIAVLGSHAICFSRSEIKTVKEQYSSAVEIPTASGVASNQYSCSDAVLVLEKSFTFV